MSQTNAAARVLHRIALGAALAALPWIAQAQFSMVPPAECKTPSESAQAVDKGFKADASRHLYTCYPARIYKGKLPAPRCGCRTPASCGCPSSPSVRWVRGSA